MFDSATGLVIRRRRVVIARIHDQEYCHVSPLQCSPLLYRYIRTFDRELLRVAYTFPPRVVMLRFKIRLN
jgi:hypothetical protein